MRPPTGDEMERIRGRKITDLPHGCYAIEVRESGLLLGWVRIRRYRTALGLEVFDHDVSAARGFPLAGVRQIVRDRLRAAARHYGSPDAALVDEVLMNVALAREMYAQTAPRE